MATKDPRDSRELGNFFAIAQVGMEMAVPIGVGVWLDSSFALRPWGVIGGAVFGLTAGLIHLVVLSQKK